MQCRYIFRVRWIPHVDIVIWLSLEDMYFLISVKGNALGTVRGTFQVLLHAWRILERI